MEDQPAREALEQKLSLLKDTLARRRLVREDLNENRRLYQSLFHHANVAMTLSDLETGKLVAFNPKAHEDLGYSADEYQAMDILDRIAIDKDDLQRNLQTTLEKGSHTTRTKIKKKDGALKEVLRSTVVVDILGKKYLHAILVDMTESESAMEKLRQSEERYRTVLETMEEGYYEVNLQGNFTAVNPAFERIYNRPIEELLGMNNREYMNSDTAKTVFRYFNELYRAGTAPSKNLEMEVIKKDGSLAFSEVSATLIRTPEGEITGFRGLVRDVTEKKLLEKALREREELYRSLFDHAGFAITLVDPQTGQLVAYNKKAYEGLGYTEEEYRKLSLEDYVLTKREDIAREIGIILEKGNHTYGVRLRRKDGEIREFLRSTVTVKIGGKPMIHSIGVDITDQKRAEKALRESEARFRNVFEFAGDAIFIIDIQTGKILEANEAAALYLGYGPEEILSIAFHHLVEDPGEMNFVFENIESTGVSFHQGLHRKKDGTRVPVEISSCLMDHQGEVAVLSIVRDVTQRKQMEKELEKHRETLEELVRLKTRELADTQKELIQKEKLAVLGQLTATVSHELRNPLGVIQSSNYYLQKKLEDRDEKTDKHLKRIDEQVALCDIIVGDLLEYTRGAHVELMRGDPLHWLTPLMNRVMEDEGVTFIKDIPEKGPLIHHDPAKMQRVVINLLNNAFQAVEEKAILQKNRNIPYQPAIQVKVQTVEDGWSLEVTDNGIGMTPDTLDQAFVPLFTTRSRGTGLGLSNVLKIMEEHGGRVSLKSDPGQGTTAEVFLPFKQGGVS